MVTPAAGAVTRRLDSRPLGRQERSLMVMERIHAMLQSCATDLPVFPPTLLYNEGWLLRLVLDWFSINNVPDHPLTFSQNARWFSEALLPSAFLPRRRKDPLGETWTHADGVIGHFVIGDVGRVDLSLSHDASHFVVLEAKMFSKLSPGVTHAKYFDQAARTVACIAEVLRRANLPPARLSSLGFYVLAPQVQINEDVFEEEMSRESIQTKVERRVGEYAGEKDQWYTDWFQPTFQRIEIRTVSWEELMGTIREHDASSASSIAEFYERCVGFGQ